MPVPHHPAANVPADLSRLDGFLDQRESQLGNVRVDCEKKIVWYAGLVRQTALSLVYLHGFSASRMETWPLCDRLAAAIGANLFYTRLTGHGQDGPAMGAARMDDWLADGIEALTIGRRIGRRVILVGTSTGATLATWLAAQAALAPYISCLVLLSPNFGPKNPLSAAALWPPAWRLFEQLCGGWRSFSITSPAHARYWTTRYPVRAITTMMQLVRMVWRTDPGSVTMPVLMLLNPWDRVINVSAAALRFAGFPSPSKRRVWFDRNRDLGRHVLAGDILSPQTTSRVLAIVQAYLEECGMTHHIDTMDARCDSRSMSPTQR